MVDSNSVRWTMCPEFLQLVPTQSLGHRGITGLQPAVQQIDFGPNDEIKIIIGSDGFWDMIHSTDDNEMLISCNSSEELCKLAEHRWKQEWNFIENLEFPENIEKTYFDIFDDVSVGIYYKAGLDTV